MRWGDEMWRLGCWREEEDGEKMHNLAETRRLAHRVMCSAIPMLKPKKKERTVISLIPNPNSNMEPTFANIFEYAALQLLC